MLNSIKGFFSKSVKCWRGLCEVAGVFGEGDEGLSYTLDTSQIQYSYYFTNKVSCSSSYFTNSLLCTL